MARYRVVYETLSGKTKVTFVDDVTTADEAENVVLCSKPDSFQIKNVSEA